MYGCNSSLLQGNCAAAIKSYIHVVSAGSLKLRDEGDTVQSACVLVTTQNVINATSRRDTVSFMLLNHPISHALAYRRNRLGLVWAKYFGFETIIDRDQSPQAKVAATAAALDASQPEGGTTNPGGVGVVNLACPHGVVNYGATVFTFTSPSSRDGSRAPTSSPDRRRRRG